MHGWILDFLYKLVNVKQSILFHFINIHSMFNNFQCMFKVKLFFWLIHQIWTKYNTSQSRISHLLAFVIGQLVLLYIETSTNKSNI